jgi:hypothetical protein
LRRTGQLTPTILQQPQDAITPWIDDWPGREIAQDLLEAFDSLIAHEVHSELYVIAQLVAEYTRRINESTALTASELLGV